jgi:hypothetical protein
MSLFNSPLFLAFQNAENALARAGGGDAGKGQPPANDGSPGVVLTETWQVFFYAFVGSVAVDVIAILAIYRADKEFPPEYKKYGYWFFRIVLALIGGVLAFAFGARTPLLALQIGATAPALIERFLQAPPPTPRR